MEVAKFWGHCALVAFFVVAPVMSVNFWFGILTAVVCLLAVEIIHGRFDDLFDLWSSL